MSILLYLFVEAVTKAHPVSRGRAHRSYRFMGECQGLVQRTFEMAGVVAVKFGKYRHPPSPNSARIAVFTNTKLLWSNISRIRIRLLYKITTKKIIPSGELANRSYKFVHITHHM